jgi:hypothetical protein
MSTSRRGTYVNYQARATAFKVGDRVYPILKGNPSNGGTVVAVWPAIGMVDVQYPHGTARAAVEDILIDRGNSIESEVDIRSDTVPGGTHTVPVSGGPPLEEREKSSHRVASRYVKQAIYWAAKGRQYKPSQTELETGNLCCPRCEEAYLRKTIYKREDGASTKLYCCPDCLFLIRRDDILGFEE